MNATEAACTCLDKEVRLGLTEAVEYKAGQQEDWGERDEGGGWHGGGEGGSCGSDSLSARGGEILLCFP